MSDRPVTSVDLRIDRRAAVRRIELGEHSWVDVVDDFVVEPDDAFDMFHAGIEWMQGEVLRYERYVPEKRLGAGVHADRYPVLRQTGMHLESRYRQRVEGVSALLYRNGDDFQGLHSDREMGWLDDTLVAIVVLGERRPFVFRERRPLSEVTERVPAGTASDDLVLMPGHGDLLVMGGACQRDWLHGIPAAPTALPRISLTWRWTSRRGRPDTNPTFYDGKQFSDRRQQPGSRSRPRSDR